MINIENVEVMGFNHAIRGMRNPMNSWEKSDSAVCAYSVNGPHCSDCEYIRNDLCEASEKDIGTNYIIGDNDHELMLKLAKAGTDHSKYRRMITVYLDITAPLYWWKEFDTYKVGTVANSCSTMHKIAEKEFTLDDFSCEHLIDSIIEDKYVQELELDVLEKYKLEGHCLAANNDCGYLSIETEVLDTEGNHSSYIVDYYSPKNVLELFIIPLLNANREAYLKSKDKKYWWQMIQLLPSSYNQRRTIMLNYEVLANMYRSRKNHKLDEWRDFCEWIESLPYSGIITGKKE